MDTRRPQLSLDELQQLKWLLGSVLATLSAWTVLFMDVQAWPLLVLTTTAGCLAIARPSWPARISRWVHRAAFPAILLTLVIDFQINRDPLAAFIRLNIMLILYRLLSHRRKREDLQLIVLGLFMVVVAGVLSVSLLFALQILAFTACALAYLLAITLAEAAAPEGGSSPADAVPRWAEEVRWGVLMRRVRTVADWRVLLLGGTLFAGVVVLSGLLFLAIPRFELNNGFFLDRLINKTTRTGFSDEVRFGEVTEITEDESIALIVDVADPAQVPAQAYWRMAVLDEYFAGGFRLSPQLRTQLNRQMNRTHSLRGTARFRRDVTAWTFYLEAGVSRYLPLLGNFRELDFTEPQMAAVSDAMRVAAVQRDPPKMLAYRVSGMETDSFLPDAELGVRRRAAAEANGGRPPVEDTLVPAATRDRLAALVQEITGGADLPAGEFADRTKVWLEARHGYSLSVTLPPGPEDPLIRWMDSNLPGNCEFFAGSLVMLAREAGFPARFVAGFRGGTWNSFSASYTVRNSDAHAWVEIFDDAAGGWLRADPTPGSRSFANGGDEEGGAAALQRITDNSWSARVESLRVFWYRRIVNFHQLDQVEIARTARQSVESAGQRLRETLRRAVDAIKAWWRQPWNLQRIGWIAGVIGAFAVAVLAWQRVARGGWLRWRSRHARSSEVDPVRREAGRWLALTSLSEWTPEERALHRDLQRLRYGARPTWPNPVPVFRRARQLRRKRR